MKRALAFLLVLLMLLSPMGQLAETRAYAADAATEDQGDPAPKNDEQNLNDDDNDDVDDNDNDDNDDIDDNDNDNVDDNDNDDNDDNDADDNDNDDVDDNDNDDIDDDDNDDADDNDNDDADDNDNDNDDVDDNDNDDVDENDETDEPEEEESDPEADVERAEDWERTFRNVTLTGNYAYDLIRIAKSQLGYKESTKNFEIRDGVKYGYNRYGEWYGMQYDMWCAMFVAFCLNYAEVPTSAMPGPYAICQDWVDALAEAGQFEEASVYSEASQVSEDYVAKCEAEGFYVVPEYDGDTVTGYVRYYVPKTGDLIFYINRAQSERSSHIGIVSEVVCGSDGAPQQVKSIEGNVGGAVCTQTHTLSDVRILGYGVMPIPLPEQTLEGNFGDLAISVEVPAGVFPTASRVIAAKTENENVLKAATELLGDVKAESLTAVSLGYRDVFGDKLTADRALKITVSADVSTEERDYWLIHVDEDGKAELLGRYTDDGAEVRAEFSETEPGYVVLAEMRQRIVPLAESKSERLLSVRNLSSPLMRGTEADDIPTEGPVSVDGQEITRVSIKWLSKSTGSSTSAGADTLELVPTKDLLGDQQFQMNFTITGERDHEPGSVEIVFPAYLWTNRSGKQVGSLKIGVPEAPNDSRNFAWTRVGNNIVITNVRRLGATTPVMIQASYHDVSAHDIRDLGVPESANLSVVVTLTSEEGNSVSLRSNTLRASIDTYARAASATKSAVNTSNGGYYVYFNAELIEETGKFQLKTVPTNLPSNLLEVLTSRGLDPKDYGYARWYVTGTAAGNQPYSMTVSDSVPENNTYGCVMLGIEGAAGRNIPSADGETVSATLLTNAWRPKNNEFAQLTQSCFVWTAYPLDKFEESQIATLTNTATITVTSADDQTVTTLDATGTAKVKLPSIYTFIKTWNDDDNIRGRRPETLHIFIYRNGKQWKTPVLEPKALEPDENGVVNYEWKYIWSDEGGSYNFDVYERLSNGSYVKTPCLPSLMSFPPREIMSGQSGLIYDGYGNAYRIHWWYHLYEAEKYPETRRWEYENKYEEATVPADYTLTKKALVYTDPSLEGTGDRALNDLLRGRDVTVEYNINSTVAHYSLDSGHELRFEVSDDYWTLANQKLTLDDVSLDYVVLGAPRTYEYTPIDTYEGYYESSPVGFTSGSVYVMKEGAWLTVAEMSVSESGQLTVTPAEGSGASAQGSKLFLPEGSEQVKVLASTGEHALSLGYRVGLTVHPTETVQGIISAAGELKDLVVLPLFNHSTMESWYDGEEWFGSTANDTAFLHGRVFRVASYLNKSFAQQAYDPKDPRIPLKVTLKATEQSNVPNMNSYRLAIEEGSIPFVESGIFYDLLPQGVLPDLDTVTINSGGTLIYKYAEDNYKNTGRTLVVAGRRMHS